MNRNRQNESRDDAEKGLRDDSECVDSAIFTGVTTWDPLSKEENSKSEQSRLLNTSNPIPTTISFRGNNNKY